MKPCFGQLEKELFYLVNKLRKEPTWFLENLELCKKNYQDKTFYNEDLKIKFASSESISNIKAN